MQPNRRQGPGKGSEGSGRSRGRRAPRGETRSCIKPVDGIGTADGAITPGGAHGARVEGGDASSPSAADRASVTCAALNLGQPQNCCSTKRRRPARGIDTRKDDGPGPRRRPDRQRHGDGPGPQRAEPPEAPGDDLVTLGPGRSDRLAELLPARAWARASSPGRPGAWPRSTHSRGPVPFRGQAPGRSTAGPHLARNPPSRPSLMGFSGPTRVSSWRAP